MATNTTNFSLPKPDANENFNRIAYNALIDAIDSKVGAKTNAADTHMVDLAKHIAAGERDKWNAAQLFALTTSTGASKATTSGDLNLTIAAGFYNVLSSDLNGQGTAGHMIVLRGSSVNVLQTLYTVNQRLYTRQTTNNGTTWSTWLEQETTAGAQAKVDAHAADAVKHISAPERAVWNGGQLWKLTDNDGANKALTNYDTSTLRNRNNAGTYTTTELTVGLPPKLQTYERYGTLQVLPRDNGSVQQIFYSFEGRMFHRYLLSSTVYNPSYSDSFGWIEFTTVGKLVNSVMGNKLVDQSNANFVGKVSGSTTANPHIVKGTPNMHPTIYSSTLQSPSSGVIYEVALGDYNRVATLENILFSTATAVNTAISQQLFSFNLIEHVQRTYGTIPGSTTTDKVVWLKNNLSKLTFNWWGFGSSPTGNKATVACYSNQWDGAPVTHTSSTVSKLSSIIPLSGIPFYIQPDGSINFLAYANVSDGTIASVINTDYVELNVELSADIKSSIPNATQSTAGLQSGADKTKLDGISAGANKTTNPAINGSIAIDGVNTVVYAHPTGDGNSHVPATGTTNGGKVLKAGATANALSWAFVDWSEILNKPSTFLPSAHNHAIADVTGLSTALSNKLDTSLRGAVNGVASLGSDGKVPTSQLPTIANAAADITIADAGNYFDGANVETGMQEIGRVLAGARTSLVASAQQLGVI